MWMSTSTASMVPALPRMGAGLHGAWRFCAPTCRFGARMLRIHAAWRERGADAAERPGMARWSRISAVSAAALATSFAVAPGAQADAGGTAAPDFGGTSKSPAVGGTAYGRPLRAVAPPQPVAKSFAIAPARVTAPALPAIRLRVDQAGAPSVRARLTFLPLQRHGRLARLDIGTVAAGRTVSVRWPSGFALVRGRYLVRLHVKGRGGQVLARAASATGRANFVVAPAPVPAPA